MSLSPQDLEFPTLLTNTTAKGTWHPGGKRNRAKISAPRAINLGDAMSFHDGGPESVPEARPESAERHRASFESIDEESRKRAEETLKDTERRYRELIRLAPTAIYELDFRRQRFLTVNDAMCELLGYSRDELLAMDPSSIMDEEGRARFQERVRRWLSGQAPDRNVEYRVRAKDGRIFDALLDVTFNKGADGQPHGATVIAHDITARKQAEADLRSANLALAEADRRKDEFLAMLAHELRNPLSVIGGASAILQRASGLEPEMQRARDVIERQARHMARLVDDLLDVSRVTQGKITLKNERVPVGDVFRHALEATAPMVRALGHKVFVSLPPDSLSIDGDAVRLAQIVSNVLNNAAKYTPAGGEIHLSAERRGADVEMRVRDNGEGIDAALLPHVFDLFVQGNRPDGVQGGLGIGLTMVRSLVQMHGGTVDAHSAGPGAGSEFVIVLPLAQAEPAPAGADEPGPKFVVARSILVVDDNRDAAEMLQTLLELDGHHVTAVHDGLAAIERAVALRPDVAVVDLGMPGMDGLEVARRLRADPSLARMVLVALTGYGREEDVRRSRDAGFDHHVTKSADFDALRRVLDSISGPGDRAENTPDPGRSLMNLEP